MSEIEVKILDINIEETKEKLLKLGAKLAKVEKQTNYMYDYKDDSLWNDFKGYCRIRYVENLLDGSTKTVLTIKKMISQVGFRDMVEEETEVSNIESTKRILTELNMYNKRTFKKNRESYEMNGVLFEIDVFEDKSFMPIPYMEVEAYDEESLKKAIELIGYKIEQTSSQTLDEIRSSLGLI